MGERVGARAHASPHVHTAHSGNGERCQRVVRNDAPVCGPVAPEKGIRAVAAAAAAAGAAAVLVVVLGGCGGASAQRVRHWTPTRPRKRTHKMWVCAVAH